MYRVYRRRCRSSIQPLPGSSYLDNLLSTVSSSTGSQLRKVPAKFRCTLDRIPKYRWLINSQPQRTAHHRQGYIPNRFRLILAKTPWQHPLDVFEYTREIVDTRYASTGILHNFVKLAESIFTRGCGLARNMPY